MTSHDELAEHAFRTLRPAVRRFFVARRAPDPDDLVGQVFLDVARCGHRFAGGDADLRRWVFTIARRRLVDDARRRRRRPAVLTAEPPDVAVGHPDQWDQGNDAVIDLLGGLTPLQHEVVVLRFVEDLPLDAVARRVGRRVGAVKSAQRRALNRMERTLTATPAADPPTRDARGAA